MAMVKKTELAYCCVLKIIAWILARPTVIVQNAAANKNLKVVQTAIPFPVILALPQPAPVKHPKPDVKPILLAYQAQQHITSARLATPVIPYLHQNAPKPLVQVKHLKPDVELILLAYQVPLTIIPARFATPVIPYPEQNAKQIAVPAQHPLPDVKSIQLANQAQKHTMSAQFVIPDIH